MAKIRSLNDIIFSLLDYYRNSQPNLDTKPGTVSRDLFIDGPSAQISRLYQELQQVSSVQSFKFAVGSDIDKYASNYGKTRNKGSKSSGYALLTFSSFDTDIAINSGDTLYSKNGFAFIATTSQVLSLSNASKYKAVASQYRNDLDSIGIKDQYAAQILVQASTAGSQGNIAKYSLYRTSIQGVTNVTNVSSFAGGSNSENDTTFKNRVLASFNGASTGTSLSYKNIALTDPATLDCLVVVPGDTLMTRDGTQVYTNPETGDKTIISEGTGGKVDVYVLGTRLIENNESYIYIDKSNQGDPTNPINDFVLGQLVEDENKTVTKKRIDNLSAGVIPNQPVYNIVEVTGSLSGSNFREATVDALGRVTGNYTLLKDEGAYAGSPWGFDKLHWVSNKISNLYEDKNKGPFNGQDALSYTDSIIINNCIQKVNVINENSRVNRLKRSEIQLFHKNVMNVTRVFNSTTGERYIVTDQNPNNDSDINYDGIITISGSSLPSVSDILQVDYTWVKSFDNNIDFDGKESNLNPNIKSVSDSVDWGYSNAVRRESQTISFVNDGYRIETIHPISSISSVNYVTMQTATVGSTNGRLSITVSNVVSNVVSIRKSTDTTELWDTSKDDGTFSGYTIFLPTDELANIGDIVNVTYNAIDIYNQVGSEGNFEQNIITIIPVEIIDLCGDVTPVYPTTGTAVEVNYTANVNIILPGITLNRLPAIKNLNSFELNDDTIVGTQPTTNIYAGSTISQNLRQAPTNLLLNVTGAVSPGTFTISGNTLNKVTDIVAIGNNGLTIELSSSIKKALGLTSAGVIPSNVRIGRVTSVKKVTATNTNEIISEDFTYNIKGYKIKNNELFLSESVRDGYLSNTKFTLPSTIDNQSKLPVIGDKLKVTYYYTTESDSENVIFTRNGSFYTDKVFSTVNSISISSGFSSTSSSTAILSIYNFNQPTTSSRYQSVYDYIAPKQNERITIKSNLNKLVGDVTLLLEDQRPVTSDVLAKEATRVNVDIAMNIVVLSEYASSANIVKQNVKDAVTNSLNATRLNTIIDSSDLVVVAQNVTGVDRVRVIYFNKSDVAGTVLSISADKNEYIQANEVTINIETR